MSFNPTFSTDISDIARNKTVNVENLNVFNDIRVGNVVTFTDDIAYHITKDFSWEELEFVNTSASRVTFTTSNSIANGINTEISGSTVLFSGEVDRFNIDGVNIKSANGGTWVDLTGVAIANGNIPAFFYGESSITGFDSLGATNLLSVQSANIEYAGNRGGITYNNAFGINTTAQVFFDQDGDHITINGLFGFAFLDVPFGSPKAGDYMYNINPAMGGGIVHIKGGAHDLTNAGGWFNPAGLDKTDPRVKLTDVDNEEDSYWLSLSGFKENVTETTFSVIDEYTPIIGTVVDSSDSERFTDGVYEGLETIKAAITIDVKMKRSIPASSNRTIGASVFVNGVEIGSDTSVGEIDVSSTASQLVIVTESLLVTGDAVTVEIRNRDTLDPIDVVSFSRRIEML